MKKPQSKAGFTLIEIMVVIVIITILVGIVIGASKYSQTKACTSRAKAEIAAMETALESFKSDNGYYPVSTDNPANNTLNSILLYNSLAAGPKVYFSFKANQLRNFGGVATVSTFCPTGTTVTNVPNVAIIDPFGVPYDYFQNPCGSGGLNNSATFDLWSYGPDNANNTADDITNWKQN